MQKQTLRFPLRKQGGLCLGRFGGSAIRAAFSSTDWFSGLCFLLHPLTYPDKLETSLREAQQAQLRVAMDLPRAGRGKEKDSAPSQSPISLQSLGLTSLPTSTVGWQSPHIFMPRSLLFGIFLCFLLTNGNRVEGLWVF